MVLLITNADNQFSLHSTVQLCVPLACLTTLDIVVQSMAENGQRHQQTATKLDRLDMVLIDSFQSRQGGAIFTRNASQKNTNELLETRNQVLR